MYARLLHRAACGRRRATATAAGRPSRCARHRAPDHARSARTATAKSTGPICGAARSIGWPPIPSAPIAIEYFNAALGHYFLTAFPEEAAALDGGRVRRRMGAHRASRFQVWHCRRHRRGRRVPLLRHAGRRPQLALLHGPSAGVRRSCGRIRLWIYEAIGLPHAPAGGRRLCRRRRVRSIASTTTRPRSPRSTIASRRTARPTMRCARAGWIGEGVAFCAK